MHPNENRLLKFSMLVDVIIAQVKNYKISNGINDSGSSLLALEKKILSDILPVQSKLKTRMKEAKIDVERDKFGTHSDSVGSGSGKIVSIKQEASQEWGIPPGSVGMAGSSSGSGSGGVKRRLDGVGLSHGNMKNTKNMKNMNNTFSDDNNLTQGMNAANNVNGAAAAVIGEDEYVSQRRHRRLSQIVPNPRKPRSVSYICSVCNEQYQHTVVENPCWAVMHQQCQKCNQMQIPRIDILADCNAIEHDPNVQALYGKSYNFISLGLSLSFKGLFLYTVGILFHIEWFIRQLYFLSIISHSITSIAHNHHTNIPLLNLNRRRSRRQWRRTEY